MFLRHCQENIFKRRKNADGGRRYTRNKSKGPVTPFSFTLQPRDAKT